MIIISPFDDYYDEAAREHPSGIILDRRGGEGTPNLGGRWYGPSDPYQVMLQIGGMRHFGVFINDDTFYWGDEVKQLGTVVLEEGRFYVRLRSRGGWWNVEFKPRRTAHPHPLLWSYAAPTTPETLYANTREWPRLAALQTEKFILADEVVQLLVDHLTPTNLNHV